ncbi:MAG: hypothetical protein L3J63_01295 [Geopsychrobacter sp.]|nr:hypothetical protein [Geopsychrobacter sp.]
MKKHILLKSFLMLTMILVLFGCSRPYSLSRLPSPTVVPYQLTLDFSSTLNDLYYIFSGPAFTYDRFPVNARLSALLRGQTGQQSSPTASNPVVLKIRIEQLTTGFEEIGFNPVEGSVFPVMAKLTPGSGQFLLASGIDGTGGDFPLPEATHKSANMKVLLQLERAGQLLAEKTLDVAYTESHYWYDEDSVLVDYYRYSYAPVLDEIYRKVLAETGDFVAQVLGQ